MRHQVSEKIGPMVNDAITKHAGEEKILWEPQLMPGQQGEAMVVCFFWMPGANLGSTMQGSFAITDPIRVTAAEVDQTVADFLREMRTARGDQIAAQAPTQSPVDVIRGSQRASGLLIP